MTFLYLNKTVHRLHYWCDDNNFGDALNPFIQRAFGIKSIHTVKMGECDLIALGSSMERLLKGASEFGVISDCSINVWGTAFHFPVGEHKWYKKIELPEIFARSVRIHALRGKLSLQRARDAGATDLENVVLGDPGLLVNRIFPPARKKKYSVGIVAHFTEKENPIFKNVIKDIPGAIMLDIFDTPDVFIKKLTQCEVILSSALHPLVVADSYGIPNIWINASGDKNISMYKFTDYYSVFGLDAKYIDLNTKTITPNDIENIKSNYKISRTDVEKISNQLILAHPYSDRIRCLTRGEIFLLNVRLHRKKIKHFVKRSIRFINIFRSSRR